MNICMFAKGIYPYQKGGMEVHTRYLVDGLVKEGHAVTVLVRDVCDSPYMVIENKFNLWNVPRKNYFFESNKLFERLHSDKPFDIIHSQSSYGYGFVKYSKVNVPLVVTFHGTAMNEVKSALNMRSLRGYLLAGLFYFRDVVFNKEDNLLLSRADRIIVGCNAVKKDIVDQYRISQNKISVVRYGEDIKRFIPGIDVGDLKAQYGIKDSDRVVLHIGYMAGQKGQKQLIKALHDLIERDQNFKVLMIGSGHEYNDLVKLSKRLGVSDNVIFVRDVELDDLPKFFNMSDVFVFPTVRLEAGALVIIESLACGIPVVTTDLCANSEYVSNYKNGILVTPNDQPGLIHTVSFIMNSGVRDCFSVHARKSAVDNFSLEKMVKDTTKVYQDLLNDR